MSWYFLGGFSAYAIVPSARVVNHSGCSVALTSAMIRCQNTSGLVCGLSTRKMRTPCDVQWRMTRRTSA